MAARAAAVAAMTASASGAWGAQMAMAPGLMTSAFSAAMAARVSPSVSVWSRPMGVMTANRRGDGIDGVEAAAEADLQHRGVDGAPREVQERERRRGLVGGDGA